MTTTSTTSSTSARPQRWVAETGKVLGALMTSRRALRLAAQATSDRRVAHRRWRLSRRRRAAFKELSRAIPARNGAHLEGEAQQSAAAAASAGATDIGATAACVRANRQLRNALDAALRAAPPSPVRKQLERLRDQAEHDGRRFSEHLRGQMVVPS